VRISRFALLWFSFCVALFGVDSLRFLQKIPLVWQDRNRHPNRRFEFNKRRQFFIGPHNKPLSIIAVCVSNEDCSPFRIHG
jgi:hypothetical protein